MRILSIILFMLFLLSCSSNKVEVRSLSGFESEKYLGKWYEIARIDNRFEKNMINTTAEYSLNPDGTIKVVNKGYDKIKNTEKMIEGKAKIIDKGLLKVYFVPSKLILVIFLNSSIYFILNWKSIIHKPK